jgi:carbamoyltransferase
VVAKKIIGISAYYHDSAAALLVDGRIAAAAQEERFTRKKHDADFPTHAIRYCLEQENLRMEDIDVLCFYEKPFSKFERILETYLAFAPRGFHSFRKAMPLWVKEKLFQRKMLLASLKKLCESGEWGGQLLFSEHHLSHAASAFYPSPFSEALVLTMDGVGEWTTTSAALGKGHDLKIIKEIHFPHSIGLLYSAFTFFTGFKVNSGEYKVMGLAPYGVPRFASKIMEVLIDLKEDGSFRLNQEYFDYCTGLKMTNRKFSSLFGVKARSAHETLEQVHMDLAASIQMVTEEIVLRMAKHLRKETGMRNLCLAGGVALNCVSNGKLLRENIFDQIWVQPAAGDAGGALGAALVAHHLVQQSPRIPEKRDSMRGSYLGPAYTDEQIERDLADSGAIFQKLSREDLVDRVSALLAEGKAVGWFQGRMEFGPRALGARSILGDARSPSMQSVLNLKVKFRESFRPFAPAVLSEKVSEWFDIDGDSPYMLMVAPVAERHRRAMSEEEKKLFGIEKLKVPRSNIPSVTHVDYSARIQTVHADTNSLFHSLIKKFEELTHCPMLVNTSFNVRGEPIVCTPADAFRCFMGTDIEVLVVENYLMLKERQDPALRLEYKDRFELD